MIDALLQSALDVNGVLALLSIIAAVDVAQFTLTLKQDRRLTRVEEKVDERKVSSSRSFPRP